LKLPRVTDFRSRRPALCLTRKELSAIFTPRLKETSKRETGYRETLQKRVQKIFQG